MSRDCFAAAGIGDELELGQASPDLRLGRRIVAGRIELAGGLKLRERLVGPVGLGVKQTQRGVRFKLLRIGGNGLAVFALRSILLAGGVLDESEIEERREHPSGAAAR